MRTFSRFSAAIAAGSIALSASPALAGSPMGLGLDLSHSSYVDSSFGPRTGNHVSAQAKTSFKASRKTKDSPSPAAAVAASSALVATNAVHDKIKADAGLHLGWYKKSGSGWTGTGSVNADAKVKLERHQSMLESMLKRTVHAVAQVSLRICKLAGGDGNTVKQCLTNRRDAFKLRVSAMIDAAFNISL